MEIFQLKYSKNEVFKTLCQNRRTEYFYQSFAHKKYINNAKVTQYINLTNKKNTLYIP
jgi:hypothetical protein